MNRTVSRRYYNVLNTNNTLDGYISSLQPDIFYELNEETGTNVVNYGISGSSLNGVNYTTSGPPIVNAIPINQTINGLNPVYNWDDVSQSIDIASSAVLDTLNTSENRTYAFCIYPRNPLIGGGGTGFGRFIYSNGNAEFRFNNSLSVIYAEIYGSTTKSIATTTTGVTANEWQWLFIRFNGTLIDVSIFINGSLNELSYSPARTSLVGSIGNNSQTMRVNNLTTAAPRAVDLAMYKFAGFRSYLSNNVLTKMGAISGV